METVMHHTGCVRQAFVHDAILVLEPEADEGGPGASVTAALCGHWEHESPCPLAPHHVHTYKVGDRLHVRVLFAAEADAEAEVRRRIELALSGRWPFPSGFTTPWHLQSSRPGAVSSQESPHAERLIRD
jgi:hypothetical protein